MIWRALWVLLWKYVKTRYCRYCHTFWETFGGVSVFIILFLVHVINLFKLNPKFAHPDLTRRMMENNDSSVKVFYSPFNNFTQELMTRAEIHLDTDSGIQPKYSWLFESVDSPVTFHANNFKTSDGVAEVKFKDNISLKTDLEYSLYAVSNQAKNHLNGVFNGLLRTITPKAVIELYTVKICCNCLPIKVLAGEFLDGWTLSRGLVIDPIGHWIRNPKKVSYMFGTLFAEEIAPPFLAQLQWAIDKSFMELLSNQTIRQEIMLTSIPTFIKAELLTLHRFMIMCTILGALPFFVVYSSRLTVERRTGIRELMKHSGIYSNVLRFSHFMEALLVGILYSSAVTTLLKITWQPLLPESDPFIIGFTIVWHFVNTMSVAFITSALTQDLQYADCLAIFLYLSTLILDFLWHSYKEYTYFLCCILPHAPIYLFWDEVVYLERVGVGTQFSNIHKSHSDNYSVLKVWGFLCIQLAVIIIISWYLDLTRPGFYGVPKRWNFFCKRKYWCSSAKRKVIQLPSFLIKRDDIHFERKPRRAEISVQVLNVSKVFKPHGPNTRKVIALDSVTFDCYKGEVTMLLGGNGAGKTTLLLIVAGMFTATEGTVFVEGFDVANKEREIRHNVGLCMQRNICFRCLTVKENIMFFKKLQGRPKEGFSVQQLLKGLKLAKVADLYGSQLSPGSMRCLQVACVLARDADVLVLDEPTTGMDLEMRHHLWDLLMVLRGNKTILMTTTCLEEANLLGDRIAILDKGVLKCHGSPTFLKNIIGTSFTLAVTIQDGSRLYELKEMVDRIIPDLECRIHEMRRIDFLLPTKDFLMFPALFEALEDRKSDFGIILIDVAMFMEEVFSKFIETGEIKHYSTDGKRHRSNFRKKHLRGWKLVCKQIVLLIKRMFLYIMKTKGFFFLLRILVPVGCLIIITLASNYSLRQQKLFSHQIVEVPTGDTRLVYNVAPFRRSGLFNVVDQYRDIKPVYASDIETEIRRLSKGFTNEGTVGFKITDNYTKIYHSLDPRATSKSINLFSNAYMSMFLPHLDNTIRTTYETLPTPLAANYREVKSKFLCLKWTSWLTFLAVIPLTPIIMLCIVERDCGIRNTHMMAGCTPVVHWGAKLLGHMIVFAIVILIPTIFIAYSLDYDNTFIHWQFILAVTGLLFTFGLAFHTYLYLLSFVLDQTTAIGEIYIASLLFGVILPMLVSILELLWQKSVYFAIPHVILVAVGRTTPQFVLGFGLARLTLTARLNAFCELNRLQCPDLEFEDDFDAEVCCHSDKYDPFPYFVSYDSGLIDLINLITQFILFATFVLLLEHRIPQYLYEQFSFSGYKEPAQTFNVHNVNQETAYVRTAIREKSYEDNVLLVKNVHKDFKTAKLIRKKKRIEKLNIVRGVSFATKLGECLAIIGPQSAGKSSLLNMLTGSMVMTRGDCCIKGIHIRRNRMSVVYPKVWIDGCFLLNIRTVEGILMKFGTEYIHKISLSSSTGGLDNFITGAQNLVFIAKLKGYSGELAKLFAHKALKCMGLLANDPLVSNYSSGCLRRLSLCSALVLGPTVAFLDEPMNEVDASSKPLVANALQRLKGLPASVIVAESTLDWRLLEPVFNRIAIMAKGQFAALGPAHEILESIARGYSARIKLRMVTAYRKDRFLGDDDSMESDSESEQEVYIGPSQAAHSEKSVMFATTLNDLKREFLQTFTTSRLCREHLSMLFFIIEDEHLMHRYSNMFRKLQALKEKYDDLIEDYYLSSVTIEDVFWRFQYEKGALESVSSTTTLHGFKMK